mgnify:FL=1
MARNAENRRLARLRFVYQGENLPTIAEALGVSVQTISRYKRQAKADGDDWPLARQADLMAGRGLDAIVGETTDQLVRVSQRVMQQLEADDQMEPDKVVRLLGSLADSMTKAVSASGRLAPKVSQLGVAQDVLRRLADYVAQHHPDQADLFLEMLQEFGDELAEAYGQ